MITFTEAARGEIEQKLKNLPEGTVVRIHKYGIGCKCKPQHPEGNVSFTQSINRENDALFNINGIPCAMNKDDYCGGNINIRIGLAGIKG